MTPRERFNRVMSFEKPKDRMPMIEWAPWWDQTMARWRLEGMPSGSLIEQLDYFGLDKMINLLVRGDEGIPRPKIHGAPVISDEESYETLRPLLFADATIDMVVEKALTIKALHDKGEVVIRLWLDGFFWFPRRQFGIQEHFYAFYDYPDLMKQMNSDLTDFNIRLIETLFQYVKPDMVGIAEDMSYNHGSMLSYETFCEFLLPYYRRLIPAIKRHDVRVLIDSDGDITDMVPWLIEAGIDGVYPLERQAGVDINFIRRKYPHFLMLGGYNKRIMHLGEDAMREEFERILPTMRSGGYIPSVDHQTPPDVSLDNYRVYLRLFEEYCKKAIQ